MNDITEEEFDYVWSNFISFLSNITCWDIDNGTILMEDRVHAVPLPKKLCEYDCFNTQPYWKNIQLETVQVEIRQYTSSGFTIIPINEDFWEYDEFQDRFYVNIDTQLATGCRCEDDCTHNVLIFRYKAGYDLEKPEWLQLLCHYFSGYTAIASKCMDIDECCYATAPTIGARLVRKTVDTINYEWELDDQSSEVFFQKLVQNFYTRLLSKYALCGRDCVAGAGIWIGKWQDESTLQRYYQSIWK